MSPASGIANKGISGNAERLQGNLSLFTVYIQYDKPASVSGSNADICKWPFVPPLSYFRGVRCRTLYAIERERVFARTMAIGLPAGAFVPAQTVKGQDCPVTVRV